ncbi:protein ABHD14A-like isoform X10 [Tachypleus tridentatus]|uniref:protein ABHD14A-like isoform X10 n=1 Tax=Tachypleus tridentatus TaxID=6853 RepID=UPI003FD4B717
MRVSRYDSGVKNGLHRINVKVFYREALPKDTSNFHISILLLNGAAFSSKTWLDLGTIQVLAAMGYRTVAMVYLVGFLFITNITLQHLEIGVITLPT